VVAYRENSEHNPALVAELDRTVAEMEATAVAQP